MSANKPDTNRTSIEPATNFAKVDAYQNTAADYEEVPELGDDFFANAQAHLAGKPVNRGGRPRVGDPRRAVTLRLSSKVLDHYKRQGAGWQTRLNADLEALVAKDQA